MNLLYILVCTYCNCLSISLLTVITGSFFSLFNFQGPLCFAKKILWCFHKIFSLTLLILYRKRKHLSTPFLSFFKIFLRSLSPPFWRVNYNTTSLFKLQGVFWNFFKFFLYFLLYDECKKVLDISHIAYYNSSYKWIPLKTVTGTRYKTLRRRELPAGVRQCGGLYV